MKVMKTPLRQIDHCAKERLRETKQTSKIWSNISHRRVLIDMRHPRSFEEDFIFVLGMIAVTPDKVGLRPEAKVKLHDGGFFAAGGQFADAEIFRGFAVEGIVDTPEDSGLPGPGCAQNAAEALVGEGKV